MRRLLPLVVSVPDQPVGAQTIHLLRVTFVIIAVVTVLISVFKWITLLRRIRNMGPVPPNQAAAGRKSTSPAVSQPPPPGPDEPPQPGLDERPQPDLDEPPQPDPDEPLPPDPDEPQK